MNQEQDNVTPWCRNCRHSIFSHVWHTSNTDKFYGASVTCNSGSEREHCYCNDYAPNENLKYLEYQFMKKECKNV